MRSFEGGVNVPRPRTQESPVSRLTPGQASYVLERLVSDRRVSPGEVNRYVSEMHREIGDLERRLQELRAASGGRMLGAVSEMGGLEKRRPGRPPGSGRPGRPPGRRRGRPPASAASTGEGAAAQPPAGRKRGRPAKRRSAALSAEQLASRQLQGRYLGLIRQIPASRRGQYQKIAKDKGREAAIKEMQDVLKK